MFDIISLGISWVGAIAGVVGVLLVILNRRIYKQASTCFLISSLCWLQRGWYLADLALLLQQSAYFAFSLIVAWRWLAPKRRCSRADLIRINYPACNAAFIRGTERKDKAVLSS